MSRPPHLDIVALARTTSVFAAWRERAANPTQRRSRSRIWLIFLLLRYGGLRLGEVLSLDDREDIDPHGAFLRVRGSYARVVQMPNDVMGVIRELLEEPMFLGLRGKLAAIDQGYLRRKFYALAEPCGLPRELLNPRVLRYSRGLELLDGGVPPQAVRLFLGRQTETRGPALESLSGESAWRIMQQYFIREVKMKTSARNVFIGRVSKITRDALLAEVELLTPEGLKIVAMITEESCASMNLDLGRIVTAHIKAPWVMLAQGEAAGISARNKLTGRVGAVKQSALATEVLLELREGGQICALITSGSAQRLDLAPGREVTALFKAFAVVLSVD
jgi:molybdate transport system regulatory protein